MYEELDPEEEADGAENVEEEAEEKEEEVEDVDGFFACTIRSCGGNASVLVSLLLLLFVNGMVRSVLERCVVYIFSNIRSFVPGRFVSFRPLVALLTEPKTQYVISKEDVELRI
ncbi:hypothetical protein CPC08DRAFT_560832 [Agrocybe pediades]|nr:hypothetical protein CPC08DRAFT_560832 [Agrocybe pediades]